MAARKFTEWREDFLAGFRESGNVSGACRMAGVGRRTAYEWRERSAKFAAEWDEAEREAVEMKLEPEAWRRAAAGAEDRGSTTLLIFLMKAHKPEKYGHASANAPERGPAGMYGADGKPLA